MERLCFFSRPDPAERGERTCSEGVLSDLVFDSALLAALLLLDPIDMKRRSFVGLVSGC